MMTAFLIFDWLLLEAVLLAYCAAGVGAHRLRGLCIAVNMSLIAWLAPLPLAIGGYVTNWGNIWYAFVVLAQCVILEQMGVAAARKTLWDVALLLAGWLVAAHMFASTPDVPGHEAWTAAVRLIAGHEPHASMASFAAWWLGQGVLILVWWEVRPQLGAVGAMVVASLACQAIDTPVFFIGAFWHVWPGAALIEAMAVGFVVKAGLAVLSVPLFMFVVGARKTKREPVDPACAGCVLYQRAVGVADRARPNGNGSVSTQM